MKRRFAIVHGTGDRSPAWAEDGSPWRVYMASQGWEHVQHPDGPFKWSGEAGRILWFLNRRDWDAASDALRYWARAITEPVVYISHSHGGQIVPRAAAGGLHVPAWIDVAGPIRGDTLDVYPFAKVHLGPHVYVYDESRWGDWTKIAGSLFDCALRIPLAHPEAINVPLPDIGHSKVLTDPDRFHFWKDAILPALAAVT